MDGLTEYLGGQPTAGIGFGAGMERLVLILQETKKQISVTGGIDVFVAFMGERADKESAKLLKNLRKAGLCCDRDYTGKSFRKQMQMADKLGCRFTAVLGDDEIDKQTIQIKNLATGEQRALPWDETLHDVIRFVNNQ